MFIRFDMIHKREKNCSFHVPQPTFFSPGDAPATITQYVAWMERQFNACQTPCSMYLSIFNSFRAIRCVSPKIAIFTTFLQIVTFFYKLSRCMYPSIFNSFAVIQTASAENRRYHVPQPTFFVSPATITQYVAWMERLIQCLPNPSQYVPIYLQ